MFGFLQFTEDRRLLQNFPHLTLILFCKNKFASCISCLTALHNENTVALPSHFDLAQFTSRAIDNWDHAGANVSENDPVTVLYLDKPHSELVKPKISGTGMIPGIQCNLPKVA